MPIGILVVLVLILVINAYTNFNNKLIMLVFIEILFLITLIAQIIFKSFSSTGILLLYVIVFIVLDSTIGISILIASSRNSYYTIHQFKSI